MVCWTLSTLIFWINSTYSELHKGTNYTSLEFPFLDLCVCCLGSGPWAQHSDLVTKTPVIPMLLFWLIFTIYPGFRDKKNLQSHYSEPSNRPCLSSLSMINDPHEFAFGFSYFFGSSYFIMHIALSNSGLSKEKLLAIRLLAFYKSSSSSQLPLCLSHMCFLLSF